MHGARRIVPALLHQWMGKSSFSASAGTRTLSGGLNGSGSRFLSSASRKCCSDFTRIWSRSVHSINQGMIGTTVLCIRKNDTVVIIGDGQVTMGSEILKPNVRKVRRIGENVIGGFAGATADAFTLFERLENKLEEHPGQLIRAAVELAKAWRTDKFLRRLDALMVVADAEISLTITGNGDVLEPYDGVVGIGSGGSYASAAARALMDLPDMDAESIARKAMKIAADCCIYTNHNFTIEQIKVSPKSPTVADQAATISIPGATTTKGDDS